MSTATIRLVAIAIVIGGLLTAALNLWEPAGRGSVDARAVEAAMVARFDDALQAGLPITRETIAGSEAVAVEHITEQCRKVLSQLDVPRHAALPQNESNGGISGDWKELDRDPDGRWSIHRLAEIPRRVVGMSRRGDESLICCWGGYDQSGPEEWTVWLVRLPQPEGP